MSLLALGALVDAQARKFSSQTVTGEGPREITSIAENCLVHLVPWTGFAPPSLLVSVNIWDAELEPAESGK